MKLLRFELSTRSGKKYMAVLEKNGKLRKVHFGDSRYEHFRDSTPERFWKHLDHLDEKRRQKYRLRAGRQGYQKIKYSPAWFSWNYLW